METETYLYPYSAGEAQDRGELALWRASHQANIACKKAIERAIRNHHMGVSGGELSAKRPSKLRI